MTKNESHKKATTAFVLVSILALMALLFPFANNNDDESTTGMISSMQKIRSVPYAKLYEQSTDSPYTIVETNNPCKPVHCSRPVAEAHPVLDKNGKPQTDEYGNVWCKCDGLAELYYRVSTERKY